jgi:Helix-turn-helix domain
MSEHNTPMWLTVTETCIALGKSDKSIRRMIARGELHAEKIRTGNGQEWRIDPESVTHCGGQVPAGAGIVTTIDCNRRDSDGHETDSIRTHLLPSAGAVTKLGRDSHIARLEGYVSRDMELLIAHAVETAQAPLLQEIAALRAEQELLMEHNQQLLKRIEQLTVAHTSLAGHLKAQAAAHTLLMEDLKESRKDRAMLRTEIVKLTEAQQGSLETAQAAVEEAVDKSLVPYLKQVQEVSAEVDQIEEENKRLKAELAKDEIAVGRLKTAQMEAARRPQRSWWKLW